MRTWCGNTKTCFGERSVEKKIVENKAGVFFCKQCVKDSCLPNV
jgi:hypothetical protein